MPIWTEFFPKPVFSEKTGSFHSHLNSPVKVENRCEHRENRGKEKNQSIPVFGLSLTPWDLISWLLVMNVSCSRKINRSPAQSFLANQDQPKFEKPDGFSNPSVSNREYYFLGYALLLLARAHLSPSGGEFSGIRNS
jgi:hypothetical protein